MIERSALPFWDLDPWPRIEPSMIIRGEYRIVILRLPWKSRGSVSRWITRIFGGRPSSHPARLDPTGFHLSTKKNRDTQGCSSEFSGTCDRDLSESCSSVLARGPAAVFVLQFRILRNGRPRMKKGWTFGCVERERERERERELLRKSGESTSFVFIFSPNICRCISYAVFSVLNKPRGLFISFFDDDDCCVRWSFAVSRRLSCEKKKKKPCNNLETS